MSGVPGVNPQQGDPGGARHSLTLSLPTPCALVDANGRVEYANSAWSAAQGSQPLLVPPGHSIIDALSDLPAGGPASEGLRALLAGLRSEFSCELATDPHAESWARLFGARNGAGPALVMIVQIAQRPSAPPAVESERRLHRIVESAMDGIITIDEQGRIVMFNAAAERIFGVPASEAVGGPLERFIPDSHRASHASFIREFGKTGVSNRTMGNLGALRGKRADGTEFPMEASISQAIVGNKRFYSAILRDVTERKRLEAQLLQAQKMEGVGRLAGGIAHDFNNIVMAIFNYLALASRRLGPDHPVTGTIAQANQAAQRAADLTRRLLTFARKTVVQTRVISPGEIVTGLAPMLARLIGEDVKLRTVVTPDAGNVLADPAQLEQVLVNLTINARDAMPSGGTLTIEARNESLDAAYCRTRPEAVPGEYVVIAVTDTGTGMTAEVQARVFEPFFTTKPEGKGTGLGLAMCHGIAKQSGGHIGVYSELGKGTAVRVYLPRVYSEIKHRPPAATGKPAPGGTETILLAEDNTAVRDLLAAELRTAGYTVLAAASGPEAIRLAASHQGDIHLLLTDVVMPDMTGVQLAEKLDAPRRMKLIYMSGYTEETIFHHGVDPSKVPFIAKPCLADTLLRLIDQQLHERQAT